jgi:hypothetical protein
MTAKQSLLTALSAAGIIFLASCDSGSTPIPGSSETVPFEGVYLDADVPGTKVYFQDRLLGEVPVRLSGTELAALGLPRVDGKNAILEYDGWGEGVFIGKEDVREHKIHFIAPGKNLYSAAQTPWGIRSRHGGGQSSMERNYIKAFLKRHDAEQLLLQIEPRNTSVAANQNYTVQVTVSNPSASTVSGYKPEVMFLWGSMDTPWRRRCMHTVQLPPHWGHNPPGAEHTISLDLPPLGFQTGVSMFCVMSLYESSDGNTLAGQGGIYSGSIWIPSADDTKAAGNAAK